MHFLLPLFYEKAHFKSTLNEAEYKVLVEEDWRPHLQKHGRCPLALKFQEGHFEGLRICMFQCQSVGIDPGVHYQIFFSYQS